MHFKPGCFIIKITFPTELESNFSEFNSKARDERFPKVGRIVSMQFFWGDHIWQRISRGPFRSSKDWLDACLSFSQHDCHSTLARYEGKDLDGDDQEDVDSVIKGATKSLAVVRRLKDLLKSSFSPFGKPDTSGTLEHLRSRYGFPFIEQDASEPSMLFHDDLNMHNILVDEEGNLTGVIDWEFVSALPLWKACDHPSFLLEGYKRSKEPDKAIYHRASHDDEEHGEEGQCYWMDMLAYELTVLRRHFLDEMQMLEPGWIKLFEASQRQRDFDVAVANCDCRFSTRQIDAWIDDIISGVENVQSLRDRLFHV